MRDVEIQKNDGHKFVLKTLDNSGRKPVIEPLSVRHLGEIGVTQAYIQAKVKEVESVGIRPMITLKLSV